MSIRRVKVGELTLGGSQFVVIPRAEYDRLLRRPPAPHDEALPPLPEPDSEGNVPAIAYARASLARKLTAGRRQAGWSQAELAKRAGVRPETVYRIENARHTPDEKTFGKLTAALLKAKVRI
jgi:DNA-binding XRE family transcriptional regulator